MTQFMASLTTDLASALVYIAIAVLFVIVMVKCVAPVVNTRRLLGRAVRQIRKGEHSKRSWQEEDFLGKGALYPHWKEYLNNLFFADGEFHNPSNVEDFINEETVIDAPGRAQFADAAPGLMVSLGFLGTLIGMTTGLSGFDMQDSEAVMASIRTLLPGVRYAFTTSIVGVVGSIATTLIVRIVTGSALRALTSFYSAMNEYAGVVSVDPMTQIAIYQQEQTALISRMAENLSSDLVDKMGKGIAMSIGKSYQGLQNSLDEFMAFATREQLRGVDLVVQRFMQQMNAAMDGQFQQLAQTLEETGRNQVKLNDYLRQCIEGLGQVSHNIVQAAQLSGAFATRLDEYLEKLNAAAAQAGENQDRLAANGEHLELVARQYNNYLQAVGHLQSQVSESLDRFQAAGEKFMHAFSAESQAAAQSMGEAAASLKQSMGEAAASLKQSGDVLAANHKALVGGISKDIDRTYNAFFKSTNEVVERMGWVIEDVKNTIARLPDTVDGAADLYARQADRLSDALRRAQDALDEAVDRLTQAMYPNR